MQVIGAPYIEGQMGPAVELDFLLIPDRLASRENDIPKSLIKKDSKGSAPALARSFALQFPGMSHCLGTQISVTRNRLEGRLRKPGQSLKIPELFVTLARSFISAWLSEKIEMRMKETPYVSLKYAIPTSILKYSVN